MEYDVHTGSPANWTADLIVTADGNMGLVSSHQEHGEHGISGTLFLVATAIDSTNDWFETSMYEGYLSPTSTMATTAQTTAGETGSGSGRYASIKIDIDAAAAQAAYYAGQLMHHINVVDAVVQAPSFKPGKILGTTGLIVKLVSSSKEVFTYQGELSEGGVATEGDYDFRFRLYDEVVLGLQQGPTVVKGGIAVAAGRFTTKLGFGDGVFNGDKRWLEIDVRDGGLTDPNAFVTLTERQEMTSTPYAIFALDSKVHKANVTVEGGHIGLGTAVDTDYGITNDSADAPLYGARFYGSEYGVMGVDSDNVDTYGRLGHGNYGGYFYNKKASGSTYGSISLAETTGNSLTFGGSHSSYSDSATSTTMWGAYNTSQAANNNFTGSIYGSYNSGIAYGDSGTIYGAYNDGNAKTIGNSKTVYGTYSVANGKSTSTGDHYGVYGEATVVNAQTYGVYGQGGKVGVYGSGSEYGVMGVDRDNVDTYGRLGHGDYGGYFYNKKPSGDAYGSYSRAESVGSSTSYGVSGEGYGSGKIYGGYFKSNLTGGQSYGVWGEAHGTGVKYGGWFTGGSFSTPGFAYGVVGFASSSNGDKYGGSFNANSSGTGDSYGVYASGGTYDFYAAGAGIDYGSSSSIRWKDDVRLIEDPLGKVSQLRGVRFVWDAEHGGGEDVGMIAEEVGAVLPEIVQYEENGVDAMGMDYSKLTPLLVEAVKALMTENEALRERLDRLEGKRMRKNY